MLWNPKKSVSQDYCDTKNLKTTSFPETESNKSVWKQLFDVGDIKWRQASSIRWNKLSDFLWGDLSAGRKRTKAKGDHLFWP